MSTPPVIIVAEPDPMVSSVLRVEFSRLDFAVLLANSLPEAEDFASRAIASLVVLDTARDGSVAYECCARIRRRDGYAQRPILITAKDASPRIRAAADTAGATALLLKPYSLRELFCAVTPHIAANDPLLTARYAQPGMASPPAHIWDERAPPEWESGAESALTRNRLLLPIVRGPGRSMPLVRDQDWVKSRR